MAPVSTYSLRDLNLDIGQALNVELDVPVLGYRQAGFRYKPVGSTLPIKLGTTLMTSGWSFWLRMDTALRGPCSRCLEDASVVISVDSHEVHDPDAQDEELRSDYVDDDHLTLDIEHWVQESIGLNFPTKVLCQSDCAGLCPQCGVNWNETSCDCVAPVGDPRWDKLKDLKLDPPSDN